MTLTENLRRNPFFAIAFLGMGAFLATVTYRFIGTIIGAVFIYYAVRPVYTRLCRHTSHNSVTALVSVLSLIVPVLSLLGYTLLVSFRELRAYSNDLTRIVNSRIGPDPRAFLTSADPMQFTDLARSVLEYVGVAGNLILHVVVGLALVFYLLRDGGKVRRWFVDLFDTDEHLVDTFFARIDRDLESIFFGNLLHALLIGMFSAMVYNTLNLIAPAGIHIPAPTLAGIITGMSSIIPVLGLKVVYAPLVAYVSAQSYLAGAGETAWFPALMLGICFALIDGIPDILLRSYVSGRTVHVGLMIFSYVFGALLFGWYGLFLGPVIAVALYHFATHLIPEYLSQTGSETETKGAQTELPGT